MDWADEPLHLEPVWRAFAFAQAADLTLVTLDGGFARRYPSVRVQTLV